MFFVIFGLLLTFVESPHIMMLTAFVKAQKIIFPKRKRHDANVHKSKVQKRKQSCFYNEVV